MALDPSIFAALGTRPKSALEYLQEMAAMEDAGQRRESNRLALLTQRGQYEDQMAARDRGNRLREAMQALGPNATDDQVISTMQAHGEFGQAGTMRKTAADIAKDKAAQSASEAAAKTSELQRTAKQIDLVLQAVSSAKDQASYTRAVKFLQANGIDTSNVPPQFDPQAVAEFGQMALTAKERAELQLKANNELIGLDGKVNQPLLNAKQTVAKAGASSVSVNTGQKGFDNTLKLRGDFRSEPVYKAHQEMQSAYSQIQQSLKQASPAGDLAGATKMMKLLDPGSVVRESELGMAMAASGLMDRVTNYAQNIINGTKLTPTQRKDFQRLADALFAESEKQYNTKRSEYEGIATRNGLNVPDVVGATSKQPAGGAVLKFDAQGNPVP